MSIKNGLRSFSYVCNSHFLLSLLNFFRCYPFVANICSCGLFPSVLYFQCGKEFTEIAQISTAIGNFVIPPLIPDYPPLEYALTLLSCSLTEVHGRQTQIHAKLDITLSIFDC